CEWQGQHPNESGRYLRTVQVGYGPKQAALVAVYDGKHKPLQGEWVSHLSRLLKSTPERKIRVAGHNFRAVLPWLVSAGLDLRPEFEVPDDDPDADGSGPG